MPPLKAITVDAVAVGDAVYAKNRPKDRYLRWSVRAIERLSGTDSVPLPTAALAAFSGATRQ